MKLHHMLFCTKLWLVKTFAKKRYKRYSRLEFKLDKNKPTFTQLPVVLERLRRYRIHDIKGEAQTNFVAVLFFRDDEITSIETMIPFDISLLVLLHNKYLQGFEGKVQINLTLNMHVTLCYPSLKDPLVVTVKATHITSDIDRLLYHAKRLNKLWPVTLY